MIQNYRVTCRLIYKYINHYLTVINHFCFFLYLNYIIFIFSAFYSFSHFENFLNFFEVLTIHFYDGKLALRDLELKIDI